MELKYLLRIYKLDVGVPYKKREKKMKKIER